MTKTIGIGYQDFEQLIQNDYFYKDNAIILEFKVRAPEDEKTLQDTVKAAL